MGKGKKVLDSYAQFWTLITLVIHFLHCLLCLSNYLDWVRHQEEQLGLRIVRLYLALTIIAIISFLLFSSVFYMWAWRYASSEDAAKRRRIWGIAINLVFADFPLFCTEVDIVWNVGFATGLQGLSFIFTCLSFAYSAIRVWLFVMVRVIKRASPHAHVGGVQATNGGVIPQSPARADNPFGLSAFDRMPIDKAVPQHSFVSNEEEMGGPTAIPDALGDVDQSFDIDAVRAGMWGCFFFVLFPFLKYPDISISTFFNNTTGGIIPAPRQQVTYHAPTPAQGIIPTNTYSRAPSVYSVNAP